MYSVQDEEAGLIMICYFALVRVSIRAVWQQGSFPCIVSGGSENDENKHAVASFLRCRQSSQVDANCTRVCPGHRGSDGLMIAGPVYVSSFSGCLPSQGALEGWKTVAGMVSEFSGRQL